MESKDYEGAIHVFERARTQMQHQTSQSLSVVSLVSLLMAPLSCIQFALSFADIRVEI